MFLFMLSAFNAQLTRFPHHNDPRGVDGAYHCLIKGTGKVKALYFIQMERICRKHNCPWATICRSSVSTWL